MEIQLWRSILCPYELAVRELEVKFNHIIDECKEYGNIILVIDEIHNIIGAGDGEHSMNAANILKPGGHALTFSPSCRVNQE